MRREDKEKRIYVCKNCGHDETCYHNPVCAGGTAENPCDCENFVRVDLDVFVKIKTSQQSRKNPLQ